MCTGAAPTTKPLPGLSAESVTSGGMIKVNGHLQLDDPTTSHTFAIGDIADTGAMKMGRAAGLQGLIAARNIGRQIAGRSLIPYELGVIEGSIDMSLGLVSIGK